MNSVMSIFNAQLLTRLISALALLPIVLGAVWYGGLPFTALLAIAALFMFYEWVKMIGSTGYKPTSFRFLKWLVLGLIYIGLPLFAFYFLRLQSDGALLVFWTFLMVWAMDVGGYFAGKIIGGPKMAPKISPNKTWAGLIGGVLLAIVASVAVFFTIEQFFPQAQVGFNPHWLWAGVMAVVAQLGDLVESQFKRHFKLKDTSGLIPGHGGLLDRADGLLLAGPVIVLLLHYGLV